MNKLQSKVIKISLAVLISIICLTIVMLIIYYAKTLSTMQISRSNVEKEFETNKDIIIGIANYLEKQGYSKIYIASSFKSGEMYVSNANEVGKTINIYSTSMSDNIDNIFKKHKYEVVTKEGNGIYFQRWSNRDYGYGIVYSTNGKLPENSLITILEPLPEKRWYFYEEK